MSAAFALVCLTPMVSWFRDHQNRLAGSVVVDVTPSGHPYLRGDTGLVVLAVVVLALAIALVTAAASARTRGDLSWRHACAAVSMAIPVVAVGVLAAVLAPALDTSAGGAGPGHLWVALALVVALFAGAVGALLVRPEYPRPREISDAERRVWSGPGAGVPLTTFLWPIGTAVLAAMVALAQPSLAVSLGVWMVAVVLLLLRIRGTHPRVEIDEDGVRMLLGHRVRAHAQLADILEVDVVHARPLRDFGGWGLRVGRGGNIGWVTRRGPALHVRRHFAGDMVITLDDPYEAVAVAKSLLTVQPARHVAQERSGPQRSDSQAGASSG